MLSKPEPARVGVRPIGRSCGAVQGTAEGAAASPTSRVLLVPSEIVLRRTLVGPSKIRLGPVPTSYRVVVVPAGSAGLRKMAGICCRRGRLAGSFQGLVLSNAS